MHVIATAGHVDHGKSTLVRAITDMEPDRWAEEHRRGLTIDLGFGWTDLPSGQSLAFVDVPGHERFVSNMLAGIGPVPAVMFVVAADEGWMPQSAEHLDALDALGVRHGLVAVTRSDIADPRPARDRALRELAATSLGEVEAVTVSGATGAGIPELREALDRIVATLPPPDADAAVRLWIDRAFSIRGAGTVVTGTLAAGTLRVGDELILAPGGRRVRVRGLQSLQRQSDAVVAVARVAVNLRVDLDEIGRGMALLTPGAWLTTNVVDVRLREAGGEAEGEAGGRVGEIPGELTVHMGAAAVPARVRYLGADTARLTLSGALPLCIGDRAVLREPGRRRIIGGATVLDVRPPALRRRGAAAARAGVLATMSEEPDGAGELARRGLMRRDELVAMGAGPPDVPGAGGWLVDPEYWTRLRRTLVEQVRSYGSARPLDPGMPLEAARRAVGVPDLRLLDELARAAAEDGMVNRDGRLSLGEPAPALPEKAQAALATLRRDLHAAPFAAPDADRLAELGLTSQLLGAAVRAGELMRITEGVYLLPDAPDRAVEILAELDQPFTVSQARTALGTTRRVAVPLLELLDSRGATTRTDANYRKIRG